MTLKIKFREGVEKLNFNLLGAEKGEGKHDNIWVFPDIRLTFPDIKPHEYYVTSGEAVAKTDKLISDVTKLMANLTMFRELLVETRGPSKFLELTKCEDGCYEGNIVARKDPKKKKTDADA